MSAYLLERGATLTPHAAARLGMIDDLRGMIGRDPGCVHQRGGDGQLPLHFARTPEIADLLLEAGADVDARDVDHESTAAHWQATRRPAVASHLVDRGAEADPFLAAATDRVDLLGRLAATDPELPRARISRQRFATRGERAAEHIYFYTFGEGMTPLHAAALTDRADSVRWMVEAGADVHARGGYDEQTPLHTAAWHDAAQAAEALLDAGADASLLSGKLHRNDPLGWAIVSGAAGSVRLLASRGATVTSGHRESAEAGAKGLFRAYNRERDPTRWVEIRDFLQRGT
jgi:ankyrin repeat protein